MSGYRLHLIFYTAACATIYYILHSTGLVGGVGIKQVVGFIVGGLYAVLPDVDTPASKIRLITSRVLLFTVLVFLTAHVLSGSIELVYVSAAIVSALLLLWHSRHRGYFHTVSAAVILSAPLVLANPFYAAMACLGYTSHLVLDGEIRI